jgi:hypothetical protein
MAGVPKVLAQPSHAMASPQTMAGVPKVLAQPSHAMASA